MNENDRPTQNSRIEPETKAGSGYKTLQLASACFYSRPPMMDFLLSCWLGPAGRYGHVMSCRVIGASLDQSKLLLLLLYGSSAHSKGASVTLPFDTCVQRKMRKVIS